jgi:hypothetical protein
MNIKRVADGKKLANLELNREDIGQTLNAGMSSSLLGRIAVVTTILAFVRPDILLV